MQTQTLFETFRTKNNGSDYLWLENHLERLKKSVGSDSVGLVNIMKSQLLSLLPFSQEKKIQVYVSPAGTFFKITHLRVLPGLCYENGVSIRDTEFERPEPSLKYQTEVYKIYGRPEDEDWSETLFVDQEGYMREGNITNVFFLLQDQWVTPPADQCFPGLMRQWFFNQVHATERSITKKEALTASSIVLTNSVKGLIPVKGWNGQQFSFNQNDIHSWNLKAGIIQP